MFSASALDRDIEEKIIDHSTAMLLSSLHFKHSQVVART